MEVTLIGTDHGDFKGQERLEGILTSISPDVIAVEMSDAELSFLETSAAKITRHYLNLAKKKRLPKEYLGFFTERLLNREVLLGYEYCASKHYCQEKDIPLVLIDDPESARATFARNIKMSHRSFHQIPTLPEGMNVSIPSLEELNRETDNGYEYAQRLIGENVSESEVEGCIRKYRGTFVGARDSFMAAKVQEIIKQYPTSRLTVVIGWMHILDDPKRETLYSMIRDLKPQRVLLHQQVI